MYNVDTEGEGGHFYQVDDETLKEIVRLLTEAAHPTRIILFGSQVRGEATRDSDLDLLVVFDRVENQFREMLRLRRTLISIRMPIDVLVYSEDDVRTRRNWPGTALRRHRYISVQ